MTIYRVSGHILRGGDGHPANAAECCCNGNPDCTCCYDTVSIDMPGAASGLSCNNSNVNDAQIDEFLGCGDVNLVLLPQATAEGVDNACCYSYQTPSSDGWTYLCNDGNNATTGIEDEDEEEGRCYFDTPTQECITASAAQCTECDPSQPYYWERHTAAWCLRYHYEINMCYSPIAGVISSLIFKEQIWFRGWINVTNQCMPYDPNNPPDPPDPLPSPPCGYSSTWYELFDELAQENTWEWTGITDVTPCDAYEGPFNLGAPTNEVLSEAVQYELGYPWVNCGGSSSFILELPAACSAISATISRTNPDTDCGNRTYNPNIPECDGCVGSGAILSSKILKRVSKLVDKADEIKRKGREAWRVLHSYDQAGEWDAWECETWYYATWYLSIPRYCECKAHWKEIEQRMPPVFSSRDGFKQWAIDAHNQVNAILGKPQWVLP